LTPFAADVPEFTMTERDGRTVTRADLLGKIWIADFFFTSCAGPCPEMALRMRSLQQAIIDQELPVNLVSISLDPEIDRPPVLRRYADRYGADPNRWWFLTGERQEGVHNLVRTGFLQPVAREGEAATIVHSTYFLLIDTKGRIRGYYEGLEPESKRQILADARRLLNELETP
jgi:protein SCO1/2